MVKGAYTAVATLPDRQTGDAPEDIMATYEGKAAGKYLVRDSDGDATAGPGYFTATATLEAMIPTDDTELYTVSGEISEFMDGAAMPLGDLVVELDNPEDSTYSTSTSEVAGMTSGSTDPLGSGTGDVGSAVLRSGPRR